MMTRAEALRRSLRIAEEVESGGRHPVDGGRYVVTGLALCWSLFQLYLVNETTGQQVGQITDERATFLPRPHERAHG